MPKKLKSTSKKRYQKFKLDKKWVVLGLIIWLVSFFVNVWPIVFLTLFSVLNTALLSFKRYFDAPVDIELSTFSAILMTVEYGLTYGIITAVVTKFASMIYIRSIKINYFFMMTAYVVAAVFADIFIGTSVVLLGVIVAVISNIYIGLVRKFVVQYSVFEVISYGITNFIFNIVLFVGFAKLFQAIMI